MNRILLIFMCTVLLTACEKETYIKIEERGCYRFHLTTVTTVNPSKDDYPKTYKTTFEHCKLTFEEAKSKDNEYESLSFTQIDGHVYTSKTTCIKEPIK